MCDCQHMRWARRSIAVGVGTTVSPARLRSMRSLLIGASVAMSFALGTVLTVRWLPFVLLALRVQFSVGLDGAGGAGTTKCRPIQARCNTAFGALDDPDVVGLVALPVWLGLYIGGAVHSGAVGAGRK